MTQKEILEGNILIAEFVELKVYEEHSLLTGIGNFYLVDDQRNVIDFSQSWDLLMPVVEKIEEIGFNFQIHKNIVTVFGRGYNWYSGTTLDSKILSVFIAVLEFIKWYNQNNKA